MFDTHFRAITEIYHRIGGLGEAVHMPLDNLRIVEALRALLKNADDIESRLAGLEHPKPKEEPRV